MDQLTYSNLLRTHEVVVTYVCTWLCTGLADVAPEPEVLRLDISESALMQPPMHPEPTPEGLHTWASFGGVSRSVFIPWGAVSWAGGKALHDALRLAKLGRHAAILPGSSLPPKPKGGKPNVIHVDFLRKRRMPEGGDAA